MRSKTARRTRARHLTLKQAFSVARVKQVWKRRVWTAYKDQLCRDLIDYYDYHRSIEVQAKRLVPQVSSGYYRGGAPLLLEASKADGLARILKLPHPDDGLVLQTITEAILPHIRDAQPSPNAFYSRSHAKLKDVHTDDLPADYPWFVLWPLYQKRILEFAKSKKFLVTTDIQNFFESIGFNVIRRALAPIDPEHGLTDFIIFLLEIYVDRDYYAPFVARGLPQLDFDAPRLLAHLVLFQIDRFLVHQTSRCFARWVDDINFGADSREVARRILRGLERELQKLGLRLGGAKTQIMTRLEARDYLQVAENTYITKIKTRLASARANKLDIQDAVRHFYMFRTNELLRRRGLWHKVLKRYYGAFTEVLARKHIGGAAAALRKVEATSIADFETFTEHELRLTIIRFWERLNPSDERVRRILKFAMATSHYDDIIALSLAGLLLRWRLSTNQKRRVCNGKSWANRRPGGFLAQLQLLTKYGDPSRLLGFIVQHEEYWSSNDFLSRQIVCASSLLSPSDVRVAQMISKLQGKQLSSISSLLAFFTELRQRQMLDSSLRYYLSPARMTRPYGLQKVIIASNVLRSKVLRPADRAWLTNELSQIGDSLLKSLALNQMHP